MTSINENFVVIGENIHTSRIVLRDGKRHKTLENGAEAILYIDNDGNTRNIPVPDWFKKTQPYEQGQIKHFMIAVLEAINGNKNKQRECASFIQGEVLRQISAGADFLDLNVDEVSYKLDIQKESMRWLVNTVQETSTVPLSIDSSNSEIIAAGLSEIDSSQDNTLINSVALERLETFDLVEKYGTKTIITAAGESQMPKNDIERVENVLRLLEEAERRGVKEEDMFVDLLVFPISVDSSFGTDYLNAVKMLREEKGDAIKITGGLSNVSFGLPKRKIINETFIKLSLEAGVDSGIVDPVQTNLIKASSLDLDIEPHRFARNMLLGEDEFCMDYIKAYNQGQLVVK
ncbi:MAG: 5-methyltetrahydrofolate--homocysteine methyltransferase [Chloroflexi bacterium]|nr:MAG: 5-methyltetrahydrofolate--homocysteine methyltransferase [Chloroflexota bacterium]